MDTTKPPAPMQQIILSMEVDDDDSCESEYRLQIGNQVKYLVVAPGTFDRDTLSFPLQALPDLPYHEEWTVANISRDKANGELKFSLLNRTLAGVKCQWHPARVDCLDLQKTKLLTAMAFEAVLHSIPSHDAARPIDTNQQQQQQRQEQQQHSTPTTTLQLPATVIAKIARFEWKLPRIEQETRAYQLLEGSGLAPRFLAHVHENGRIMGFLLEKTEGRPASFQDLSACEAALRKLHGMGLVHGDVNRYNFLVTNSEGEAGGGGAAKLLDFECSSWGENASPELMAKELESLRAELVDESGRGGGFIFRGDDSD
jgi:hypothetical protein